MRRLKVAIIDVIGLVCSPETLTKQGLGGSETAYLLLAKELQALGFEVTVFNNCIGSVNASEGTFDGVQYVDISRLKQPNDYTCDIMVGSRSVLPFLPEITGKISIIRHPRSNNWKTVHN